MREILNGIFTWPWFSEPHGYNFNGHFIRHPGGNLCIDPVEPTATDLEELARFGVSRILLTNRNHSRARKAPS
jgi:Metallo-beta-lactamase superfamily